mmetsp:Transcript_89985/g.250422  ORF Transcript_89985/g.250422 Transcript_89985/m.250422 type:complete len:133 (+) Transcript_89985:138-536(+)
MAAAVASAPLSCAADKDLKALAHHRTQPRRTLDGRLCAAAFVQDQQVYTDCTAAANPSGEVGRPWCYVEPQVASSGVSWGNCAPAVDYIALRAQVAQEAPSREASARALVARLAHAEQVVWDTVDRLKKRCS